MEADTDICSCYNFGVVVDGKPSLSDVDFLPLVVSLAENLIIPISQRTPAGDNDLDLLAIGRVLIVDVKGVDEYHKVLIGRVRS